jgi:hypothetical protein
MKQLKDVTPAAIDQSEYRGSNLPVTREDFDALSTQRQLLLEFVAKQLRKDIDYGVIPGTPKPSLFKPGAEKLTRLFGLGSRFTLVDKTLEGDRNFALFNYKCEIFHLKSGQVIAECDGTANSQEKKYKERTVYIWNDKAKKKLPEKEATPVFDILNTLQKMAQKRAYVGAVILATGASDFFTQDIDDVEDASTVGATPNVGPTSSSIPTVTKVTSETQVKHDSKDESYMAEALTDYDQKDIVKQHGFRWDKDAKKWMKRITAAEAASLPFETAKIA